MCVGPLPSALAMASPVLSCGGRRLPGVLTVANVKTANISCGGDWRIFSWLVVEQRRLCVVDVSFALFHSATLLGASLSCVSIIVALFRARVLRSYYPFGVQSGVE